MNRLLLVFSVVAMVALVGCKDKEKLEEGSSEEESDDDKTAGPSEGADDAAAKPSRDMSQTGAADTATGEGPSDETRIVDLALGNEATCALRADKRVLCWGHNENGTLGLEDPAAEAVLPQLLEATDIEAIWMRESNSVAGGAMFGIDPMNMLCMRNTGGDVTCVGHDEYNVLRKGEKAASVNATMVVAELKDARDMSFGGGTSCAVMADGGVVCWGSETFQALGRKPAESEKIGSNYGVGPVDTVQKAAEVAVGLNHACARTEAGALWFWGEDTAPEAITHENVKAPIQRVAVAQGDETTCVIDADGAVVCADSISSPRFEKVAGIANATDVAVMDQMSCALDGEGAVHCWCEGKWSWNDCTKEKEGKPLPVALPEKAVSIDVGERHACAVLESGTVACWGENRRGQLGDGTLTDRLEPVLVKGLFGDTTTLPPLPAGAELGAVDWPGEGREACADLAAPAGENYTPRTAVAEPSRTAEGHWSVKLILSEDVFDPATVPRLPRPRGKGAVLRAQLTARTELQRSPNGKVVAYGTVPLAAGDYTPEGEFFLDIDGMDRRDDMWPPSPTISLTHVDVEGGVICGTVNVDSKNTDTHVIGRFAATVSPEAVAAAAMVEEPAALDLKPINLATGDTLTAVPCNLSGLPAVGHNGSGPFRWLDSGDDWVFVGLDQDRFVTMAFAEGECTLGPVEEFGVGGTMLPDEDVDDGLLVTGSALAAVGSFGRVYDLSGLGAASERCKVDGHNDIAVDASGALIGVKSLQVHDAATCAPVESADWSALGSCDDVRFVSKKQAVALCGDKIHLLDVAGGKAKWSGGSAAYNDADHLPSRHKYIGLCGKSVCMVGSDDVLVWKSDGTFAGRVDIKETYGTEVFGATGGATGLQLLLNVQRGESVSYESQVVQLTGFP